MDPDETWKLITSVDTEPEFRATAALNLLCWIARGGFVPPEWVSPPSRLDNVVTTCEIIIHAEFDALDRMMGE